jgi:4-hydroxy-tetrahydrodipicolinate synthase
MSPMPNKLLTAMITPFDQSGELNLREAGRLARFLVNQGNDGVVVAGSTGEGTSLSDDEKIALFTAVKAALSSKGTVIAGTGNANTRGSVALTKRAEAIGVDGILATVPAYCKPTQEGMLEHFGEIAAATTLPIIIYNIPGRTAANLQAATLNELSRHHKNVIGVKESSGDFQQMAAIVRDASENFTLWCGDDYLFLPSLAIGAAGLVSVAGHLCARELRELTDAYERGDTALARRIHLQLTPLFVALFTTTSPIPIKWAMRELGFDVGACRSPLGSIPASSAAQLRPLLAPYVARTQAELSAIAQ